jgi:hypothetical protein
VIPAVEALRLQTAQLSDEEKAAADRIESEIEEAVRKGMTRSGLNFQSKENRPVVIAEINQRMKAAGYEPGAQLVVDVHPLNKAQQIVVGFRMGLAPTDESYRAYERALLS